MADKPTQYPDFALNDELDPITLAPNKVEPTDEFKLSGQKRRQPFPRPYLNWQFWNIGAWIRWFEEQLAGSPAATLQSAFPINTIHLSADPANPASYFGFGTWVAIGQGRTIIGVNTGDPDFNTVLKTGGSKTHNHGGSTAATTLSQIQIPTTFVTDVSVVSGGNFERNGGGTGIESVSVTENPGGGQPHSHNLSSASNLSPYITLFIWQRTA